MDSSSRPDWRSSLTGAADPLHASARQHASRTALVAGEDQWTWRELHRAASQFASRLTLAGVATGERVGVLTAPGAAAVLGVHAVARAGGVVVPLHHEWTGRELAACVAALGIHLVIVDSPDRLVPASVRAIPTDPEGRTDPSTIQVAPPRDPADVHSIIWTSGTAGRPHGVALSLVNHLASAVSVAERLGVHPGDRWALSLSPAHVGGLALVMRAATTAGAIVTPVPPGVEGLARLLDDNAVAHASVVPTGLRRLLDARSGRPAPSGLRTLLVGGDAAPPDLVEAAQALGYPVALTYGLTEATSQVATAPPSLVRRKPGCCGPPLGGVSVRIADDGEILVRGPTVMMAYVDASPSPVVDGWLHTGDLGRLDEEGHLTVTGRKSARIISGGVNVDPADVAAGLRGHPDIDDALVVGLPDAEWGERVAALVVTGDPRLTPERVLAWCAEHLAPPRRPRVVRVADRMPLNPNGKPDAAAARALLEGHAT